MATATATIDLNAIRHNWQKLRSMSSKDTGAVVKANAYGLGLKKVAEALYAEGARIFFVATAEEGIVLNKILPKNRKIYILNGYDKNYKKAFIEFNLIPVLNSPLNLTSFFENNKSNSACIQIDVGMRRFGFQLDELFQFNKTLDVIDYQPTLSIIF